MIKCYKWTDNAVSRVALATENIYDTEFCGKIQVGPLAPALTEIIAWFRLSRIKWRIWPEVNKYLIKSTNSSLNTTWITSWMFRMVKMSNLGRLELNSDLIFLILSPPAFWGSKTTSRVQQCTKVSYSLFLLIELK